MPLAATTAVPRPATPSRRMSPADLRRHADDHTFALEDLAPTNDIDLSRPFVCESTTPLYYCPVYADLPDNARLRYNQLVGLFTNEIISWFESHFAAAVLGALLKDQHRPLPDGLGDTLRAFIAEEQKHEQLWRSLSRRAAPDWYADHDYHILQSPPGVESLVRFLTHRPNAFPVVLWLMLLQEERSIDISRRSNRAAHNLEPHFAAAYRAHLHEEVRHVQIDWHLIEHYYTGRSPLVRRTTALLLRAFINQFLLAPRRSAMRVIDLLIAEMPDLHPLRHRILAELRNLRTDDEFIQMMYSRQTTPIAFALFDRFSELHSMSQVLRTYQPAEVPA